MAFLRLSFLLHLGRALVAFFVLAAGFAALLLLARSVDATTGDSDVRLVLDTNYPNMFTAIHAMETGLVAGGKANLGNNSGSSPQKNTQTVKAITTGFALTTDPQTPVLRYHEPSSWKRLALLHLRASNDYQSLAWVVFFAVGSWLLWRLLLDVRAATPFTFANAHRLRGLGLLVLGLNVGQELAYLAVRALVPSFRTPSLAEPLSHYVRLNTETSLPGWEVGLMLLIIAAVYQRGVELSREAELVI